MKPLSKHRACNQIDCSLGQHETASCYDFTKLKEALSLEHSYLINNVTVDYPDIDSNSLHNKSTTSCNYDFSKVAEALAIMEKEAKNALPFRQNTEELSRIKKSRYDEEFHIDDLAFGQRLKIGRRNFSRTKNNKDEDLLKMKKGEHKKVRKMIKTQKWQSQFNLTLKSLKKCS